MIFPLEEKELLIAAHKSGEFYLFTVFGRTRVQAGGKDFVDNNDPAIAAIYREALESLCKDGYVRQESTEFFKLTGSGWKKARELAEEEQ